MGGCGAGGGGEGVPSVGWWWWGEVGGGVTRRRGAEATSGSQPGESRVIVHFALQCILCAGRVCHHLVERIG